MKRYLLLALGFSMSVVAQQTERHIQPAVSLAESTASVLPLGIYQHYKGDHYLVMGVCKHTETEEVLVYYRSLYGDYAVWARPLTMFTEEVEYKGKVQKRFTFVRAA